MKFDWDEAKNRSNIEKHGVSFEQASTVFDGFVVTRVDNREDYGEVREITLGLLNSVSVLVVAHTERGERIRFISARPADRNERNIYDKALQRALDG